MNKIRITGACIAILIVVGIAIGAYKDQKNGQAVDPKTNTVFKTMVRFENSKGAAITSLVKGDLQVRIDKIVTPLVLFESAKTPLSLFLILDVASVEDANELHTSLQQIISRLPHDSEVSFMSSNLGNESSNQFSKDPAILTKLIQEYKPEGRSTFFISVLPFAGAASRFVQKSERRAAAIYITTRDSFFENDIIKRESEVIRQRFTQAAVGVPIFGIYLGDEKEDHEKCEAMLEILKTTGGSTVFAKNIRELNEGIAKIISVLDGLYMVGIDVQHYLMDGKIHHMEVQLNEEASKKYVEARSVLASDFALPVKKSQPSPTRPLENKPDSEAKSKSK